MFNTNKRVMALAILFFCMAIGASFINTNADEEIRDGVYVEDVNISNMTEEEAKEAIEDYVEDIKAIQVSISINGKTAKTTVGNLGYRWANTNLPDEALNLGKKGNIIRRYKDKMDIDNNGKVFELEMSITEKKIKSSLQKICEEYNVEAKNASLKLTSYGFDIVPEQTGVVVDYDQTTSDIYKYITEEWDGETDISIEAVTEVDEPEYTSKDLEQISSTPMGTYTTTFGVGSSYTNRNLNIKNGANLLDGAFLYPGEQYSLNEHLAPWTEENGYYPAGTYVDGGVQDSLGGGICQVSSTLYNALLLAEIEIVERYPHSMSVSYVPLAADAALAGDYKDLVFRNNTDAPIYIQAIYYEGSITFKVYGHDTREAGRSIEYKSETISTTPIKTEVEKDDTQPEGYEETISTGHVGYVAKLWKYVYQDGVEVEKTLVNTSTYNMSPTKVIKGTKKIEEETTTAGSGKKNNNKNNNNEESPTKKEQTTETPSDSE